MGPRVLRCFAASFIASATTAMTAAPPPTANVTSGALEGVLAPNGVAAFLGVPFAAPPQRWHAPEPVVPWSGVRPAIAFASACVQFVALLPYGSEDCLYANIYAPPPPADGSLRPVLVWIHGGGMVMGNGASDLTDYAAATGVIAVSLQYRLGFLGFGFPRGMVGAAANGTTPNVGVLDWIAGLQWVRDNARAFGGDAARVTVTGESAGGMNIMYLLTVPRAFGLYSALIAQSPGTPAWNASKANALADGIAARVGCPSAPPDAQLACLLTTESGALVEATAPLSPLLPIALGPCIDGAVVAASPRAALAAGSFNPDPALTVVVWSTGAEGDGFMLSFMELSAGCIGPACLPATEAAYNATMAAFWGAAHQYPQPIVEAIAAQYAPLARTPAGWFGATSMSFSEGTIGCPVRSVAQAAARGLRVFRALVNESVPELGFAAQPLGVASHTTDVALLHNGTEDGAFPALSRVPFSAAERTVITAMWAYVGNLAATGDPNVGPFAPPGGVHWPRYVPGESTTLVLSHLAPGRLVGEYEEAACDGFWAGIYI